MNTKKSIQTAELATKLSQTENVFLSFTGEQIAAIIAAVEMSRDALELMASDTNTINEEIGRREVVLCLISIIDKIEDTFNEELQAQKTEEMLQQLKQKEYNDRVEALRKLYNINK